MIDNFRKYIPLSVFVDVLISKAANWGLFQKFQEYFYIRRKIFSIDATLNSRKKLFYEIASFISNEKKNLYLDIHMWRSTVGTVV